MNKKELVAGIAQKTGFTQKDAEKFVNDFCALVADELKKGEKIQLMGFGTFEVKQRNARTGKNPRTGEAVTIPATKVPAFKAGKALKEKVNG